MRTRVIPTRVHGLLDYSTGAFLVAAPWLLGFRRGGAETWLPVALGGGAIAYSLVTDYELGVSPVIGVPAHLSLDAMSGVLLAASPWLFGFAGRVRTPHLVLGLFEVAAALLTETEPGPEYRRARRAGAQG